MEENLGRDKDEDWAEDDAAVPAILDSLKGRKEPLAFGQETARAVLDIVKIHPELHDQDGWEKKIQCGTTRCVAGWAAFLHPALTENVHKQKFSAYIAENPIVRIAFAEEVTRNWAFEDVGKQVLALENPDAARLFYDTTETGAVQALEFLAAGQPIDWDAVERP